MARDAAVFVKEVPMCVTRNVGAWSEKEGRREKAGGVSDGGSVSCRTREQAEVRVDMCLLKFRAREGIMI